MVASSKEGKSNHPLVQQSKLDRMSSSEVQRCEVRKTSAMRTGPSSKSVSWYPGVSVRECLHINNFTDDEVDRAWYKRQDFTAMKQSFQSIVRRLGNGSWEGDSDTETARGLEYRHREGAMKRKVNKLNGLMAVLDEQERQWQNGIEHNDVAISDAYVSINLKCSFSARMMGMKDEVECEHLWNLSEVVYDHTTDTDLISILSKEMRNMSVSEKTNSKRKEAAPALSPRPESSKKKTRLKQFMKKVQIIQRVTLDAERSESRSKERSESRSKERSESRSKERSASNCKSLQQLQNQQK